MNQKQTKFNECLSDMKKVLDENNIHFFLVCGTCLGAVREKGFIEHDGDIDIGIMQENYNPSIKDIVLSSKKFKLRRTLGKEKESLEFTFNHNNGVAIDIFIHYKISENYYYTASFFGLCANTKEGYCKWGRHIRGFKTITMYDNIYNIPSNETEYLTDSYGADFMKPKKFSYNAGLNGGYKNLINK